MKEETILQMKTSEEIPVFTSVPLTYMPVVSLVKKS